MKSILMIAATEAELNPLKTLDLSGRIEFLCTGIGLVNTALNLDRKLRDTRPDLIIQTGICGSWKPHFKIGDVIEIREEIYSELGAESKDGFLDLETLGFKNFSVKSNVYYNRIVNPCKSVSKLPFVRSISVNRVHGTIESIRETQNFWNPDTESMEGAAFFQVCLENEIDFAEIRSVSNFVEERNRASWDIPLALKNLRLAIQQILSEY